jgi:hypothetical protein
LLSHHPFLPCLERRPPAHILGISGEASCGSNYRQSQRAKKRCCFFPVHPFSPLYLIDLRDLNYLSDLHDLRDPFQKLQQPAQWLSLLCFFFFLFHGERIRHQN